MCLSKNKQRSELLLLLVFREYKVSFVLGNVFGPKFLDLGPTGEGDVNNELLDMDFMF